MTNNENLNVRVADMYYYADKKFCRLDIELLPFIYDSIRQMPFTHPYIVFLGFLDDLRERNRLQNNLKLVYKTTTDNQARSIHPSTIGGRECVIMDLKERIRKKEIKIEYFHNNYYI